MQTKVFKKKSTTRATAAARTGVLAAAWWRGMRSYTPPNPLRHCLAFKGMHTHTLGEFAAIECINHAHPPAYRFPAHPAPGRDARLHYV